MEGLSRANPAAAEDTIVAVATAAGPSTCALLRLSGPAAISAASRLLELERGTLGEAHAFTVLPALLSLERARVPARAVVFRAPRSYTREDLVEIALVGSPPLVAEALASFLALELPEGEVRLAHPGEFTLRAFRSGRIDLTQAEAVASLIGAASEAEGRAAERQLRGELRAGIEAILEEIVASLALVEAALDFPDEDLPQIAPEAIRPRIVSAIAAIDSLRSASSLRLPDTGALRAALAGFPNAGKSSLLNALLGRAAAIVAELAGTTRDPVRGQALGPGGRSIEWIDLAGFEVSPPPLGEARVEEGEAGATDEDLLRAVARLTRRELESADVLVWVVDLAGPERERSLALYHTLRAPRKVLALNKADLLDREELTPWHLRPERPVVVSALRGEGLEELTSRVAEGGGCAEAAQFLITARQEAALARARARAEGGLRALERGEGYELVAVDLRDSLGALHELTGREVGEKVLQAIFGQFCIGK